jgi:hypothetical protein
MLPDLSMDTIRVRDQESRWRDNEDEFQFWPRSLWIDPGESTGLTVFWTDPAVLLDMQQPTLRSVMAWWTCQLQGSENSQTHQISLLVRKLGGPTGLAVGIEDFILQTRNSDRAVLSPVRITAKLEFAMWRGLFDYDGKVRRREMLAKQSASDAKKSFTDDRLKRANLYTPGPDHIRDSTRHALLWQARCRVEEQNRPGFFRKWYRDEKEWW